MEKCFLTFLLSAAILYIQVNYGIDRLKKGI